MIILPQSKQKHNIFFEAKKYMTCLQSGISAEIGRAESGSGTFVRLCRKTK